MLKWFSLLLIIFPIFKIMFHILKTIGPILKWLSLLFIIFPMFKIIFPNFKIILAA